MLGDGLLPADFDGSAPAARTAPSLSPGRRTTAARHGATFDALTLPARAVDFPTRQRSTFTLKSQLPIAPFDSIYPCGVTPAASAKPTQRPGLPAAAGDRRPGTSSSTSCPTGNGRPGGCSTATSARTRPSSPTSPSRPGRSSRACAGTSSATRGSRSSTSRARTRPWDGVHRWMGSVAMDKQGNIAAGYSVVNGTNVFPGIRYTGRLRPTRSAS